MGKYIVGPSTVHLRGHATPAKYGSEIEHDFSVDGPHGEHGPAQEAALIAAGALTPAGAVPDRPSARRRVEEA